MGYCSNVEALIYGPPDMIDALCMKFHHVDGFDLWGKDAFGSNLIEWTCDGVRYISLKGENWKWYEDYPDVQAWGRFQMMAEEFDLNVEFVRIGEDNNDIDTLYLGPDLKYYLEINICNNAPQSREQTSEQA